MEKDMTKSKWLEMNGFNEYGETYIVLGDSYSIKDNLKEANFKFSPLLRWHADNNDFELPETCSYIKLDYNDVFSWNEDIKATFMKEGARDFINNIFNPPKESTSEYQGIVGNKISIECKVSDCRGFNSAYGYKYVYTFEDNYGNIYNWFTTTQQSFTFGMPLILTGTVKDHVEYKGVKTTQLIRCKSTSL